MIYLDMDGVLADFNTHVRDLGIPRNEQWYEPRKNWTEETLKGEALKREAMHTPGFWTGIPLMPGADMLWRYANQYPVYVLTAKPHDDSPINVSEDKLEWINAKLGRLERDHFLCCLRSEKQNFIGHSGHKFQVLVDDDPRNCQEWEKGGGISVHHVTAIESIHELKRIMNKYDPVAQ